MAKTTTKKKPAAPTFAEREAQHEAEQAARPLEARASDYLALLGYELASTGRQAETERKRLVEAAESYASHLARGYTTWTAPSSAEYEVAKARHEAARNALYQAAGALDPIGTKVARSLIAAFRALEVAQ